MITRHMLTQTGPGPRKLTAQDVTAIRALVREERVTIQDLAAAYGLSRIAIHNAVHGITWAHVPDPVPTKRRSTWLQGEKTPLHKLTEPEVRDILRLRLTEQWTYQKLAARYRVHFTTIAQICQGKIWKHLQAPLPFPD